MAAAQACPRAAMTTKSRRQLGDDDASRKRIRSRKAERNRATCLTGLRSVGAIRVPASTNMARLSATVRAKPRIHPFGAPFIPGSGLAAGPVPEGTNTESCSHGRPCTTHRCFGSRRSVFRASDRRRRGHERRESRDHPLLRTHGHRSPAGPDGIRPQDLRRRGHHAAAFHRALPESGLLYPGYPGSAAACGEQRGAQFRGQGPGCAAPVGRPAQDRATHTTERNA